MLAHGSVAGHLAEVALVCTMLALYIGLWSRRPTRTVRPVIAAAAAAAAMLIASSGWVESAAERSFSAHMIQHLILWVVIAPLLFVAHPFRTAHRAGFRIAHHRLRAAARQRRARFVAAWIAFVAAVYATHLSPMYDATLVSYWLHLAEHSLYLVTACLLWATILGSARSAGGFRAGLAAATAAPMVLLGAVLSAAATPLYPTYDAALGPARALADQRAGAAIMWLGSMVALAPLTVASVWRWANHDHESRVLAERLAATGTGNRPGAPERPPRPGDPAGSP